MRIVIVDDDIIYLNLMKRHLSIINEDIILESDPNKVLNLIKRENVDVVISDVIMPIMDGVTLLKKIKKINNGVFVILHTCNYSDDVKNTALKNNAFSYYEKPSHELIINDINYIKKYFIFSN